MWARRVAARLFLDRQAAFWRAELWDRCARVVDVIMETRDTKTFVLSPRAPFRGHRAGQFVPVTLEVDGVRVRRCYSISSAPGDRVAITVKRLPGGRASSWLHDRVRAGAGLELGAAAGEFVLPTPAPVASLFVSGGSGVTPIMSMLRQLARERALGDAVVVHHARDRDDVIFGDALEALAAEHRGMRLLFCFSKTPGGRFDEERLARLVPDYAARSAFLCGPPGLMARVEAMWRAAGAEARLTQERFVAPAGACAARLAGGAPVRVALARSRRTVEIDGRGTLLEQLERAGVRPPSGCRIGVCHTCRCRKRDGVVQDLSTGALSTTAEEDIQPCISLPRSNLELVL